MSYVSGLGATLTPAVITTTSPVAQVEAVKGSKTRLEALLKTLSAQLATITAQIAKYQASRADCRALITQQTALKNAISLCSSYLKAVTSSTVASAATRIAAAKPAGGAAIVVESSTMTATKDGVVPGPGAQVVTTPTLDPPQLEAKDVTVSSGSIGTVAVVGAVALLGFFWLKKRGHV